MLCSPLSIPCSPLVSLSSSSSISTPSSPISSSTSGPATSVSFPSSWSPLPPCASASFSPFFSPSGPLLRFSLCSNRYPASDNTETNALSKRGCPPMAKLTNEMKSSKTSSAARPLSSESLSELSMVRICGTCIGGIATSLMP